MVRNSVENYATVHWPLVTVIEYAIFVSHTAKEIIIIRFITLGNVYFTPYLQLSRRPFFVIYSTFPMTRHLTMTHFYASDVSQRPIY